MECRVDKRAAVLEFGHNILGLATGVKYLSWKSQEDRVNEVKQTEGMHENAKYIDEGVLNTGTETQQ